MKYKLIFIISLLLWALHLYLAELSFVISIPLIIYLTFRDKRKMLIFMKYMIISNLFLITLYFISGRLSEGLTVAAILLGSSLSIQFYFLFFKDTSLYLLLKKTGLPENHAFIIATSLNYVIFIKPIINEIQDAQRLRGIDIPKGFMKLFYLPKLFIPLIHRLVLASEHLAETLHLKEALK